eukprot:CAMPEP_0196659538 /NCGR_PEP_ID=MMETSP1086-20130531/35517_1 /TAXON_ID=77921 /ORGANISM="Cyanoptyche  gloeocystis , Strain SAG4.97" /LENGTH=150 /DNA_ID=CAMNT_0041993567 /DNA_START=462 /DNA_END=915 /DNA_ORIENTATION=-
MSNAERHQQLAAMPGRPAACLFASTTGGELVEKALLDGGPLLVNDGEVVRVSGPVRRAPLAYDHVVPEPSLVCVPQPLCGRPRPRVERVALPLDPVHLQVIERMLEQEVVRLGAHVRALELRTKPDGAHLEAAMLGAYLKEAHGAGDFAA